MGKLYLSRTIYSTNKEGWAFDVAPRKDDPCIRNDGGRNWCTHVDAYAVGKDHEYHPDVPVGKCGVFEFVGLYEDGKEPEVGEFWVAVDKDGYYQLTDEKPVASEVCSGDDWSMVEECSIRDVAKAKHGTATRFKLVPVETITLADAAPKPEPKPAPTIESMAAEIAALKLRIEELEAR